MTSSTGILFSVIAKQSAKFSLLAAILIALGPVFLSHSAQAQQMENLTPTVPEFRGKRSSDFIDKTILNELERDGFFTQLSTKYGK